MSLVMFKNNGVLDLCESVGSGEEFGEGQIIDVLGDFLVKFFE
jgi:hypothetical protein